MNELELLDKFDEQMWLAEWENEDLPIILEILEECMLSMNKGDQNINWKRLEIYFNCLKWWQKIMNFKQEWFDSFDTIKARLIEDKIIPTDQEMQKLINERRKNWNIKTIELKLETNQKVNKIINH